MAVILAETMEMKGNSAVSIHTRRIVSSMVNAQGKASTNSRFIKVAKGKSGLSALASVTPLKPRVLKYLRANPKGIASTALESFKFKTVKGDTFGQATSELYVHDWDVREAMLSYLPPFYQDIKDIYSLISSEANEFTRLYALLDELSSQFFVDTATYALDDWLQTTESRLGVGSSATQEAKRNAIKSRLNGLGTITSVTLETVVSDFYESELIELPEPGVIRFKLIGIRGEPIDMPEIKNAVNDVIPAHLEPEYEYTFLPWSEVEQVNLDWDGAEMFTYKELEESFLVDQGFPHQN